MTWFDKKLHFDTFVLILHLTAWAVIFLADEHLAWERSPLTSRDINRFDIKVSRGMFDDKYGSYFPQKIWLF